jgi:hypothetical protein
LGVGNIFEKISLPPNPHLAKTLSSFWGKVRSTSSLKPRKEGINSFFSQVLHQLTSKFFSPSPLLKFLEKGVWGKNFFAKKFFPQKQQPFIYLA